MPETETAMIKCVNCGHPNPPGKKFCSNCGDRVTGSDEPTVLPPEEVEALRKQIEDLQEKLALRAKEIEDLEGQLKRVTEERDKLAVTQPQKQALIQQIDSKEGLLQEGLHELDKLRGLIPHFHTKVANAKPAFVIESHPIKKPEFDVTFGDAQQTLDLSTTGFGIHASLERDAAGAVNILIHPGATVAIKGATEKRWRRAAEGERVNAEPGMVLFDKLAAMNARLDMSS